MTTENYMKRYHAARGDSCELELAPLRAEEVFPGCESGVDFCPCRAARFSDRGDCDVCSDRAPQDIPDAPCCCKSSMVEALRLLCGSELSERVDFNAFFFLTDALTVGGPLGTNLSTESPADNINALNASLERFSPCNCDLLEVDGTAYFAIPPAPAVAIQSLDTLSLCSLKAVAFQLSQPETDEEAAQWDRHTLRLIRRAIRCEGGDTSSCGVCQAHCDCDDCCCNGGLLTELAGRNLSRQATLSAGPLLLRDVTVLGSVGSVLVLWNEADRRVYFVCVEAIEVLA